MLYIPGAIFLKQKFKMAGHGSVFKFPRSSDDRKRLTRFLSEKPFAM